MRVDGLTPKLRTWIFAGTIEFYRMCQASAMRLVACNDDIASELYQ